MKDTFSGDGGEDTVDAGAQSVYQKRVNVSVIHKGRNDDGKMQHGIMKLSLRFCGFLNFEITKKPEKQTEPFYCMKTTGQRVPRKNPALLKGIRATDSIEQLPTSDHSTRLSECVKGKSAGINSPVSSFQKTVIPAQAGIYT